MRVDIDKLEALEKAGTPGPWRYEDSQLLVADPDTIVGLHVFSCCNWDDEAMEAIVGIRNAFPELLSEVRELRGANEQGTRTLAAVSETLLQFQEERKAAEWTAVGTYYSGGAGDHEAELRELRGIAEALQQAEARETALKDALARVLSRVPSYRAYSDDDAHHCAYCYGVERWNQRGEFDHKEGCEWAAARALSGEGGPKPELCAGCTYPQACPTMGCRFERVSGEGSNQ